MAKPYYEFFCPVKVIAGHAALEHIPFELASLGAKRPMIITDKGVRANHLLAPIEAAFESTDIEIGIIFDDVPPDSSLETVRAAAQAYRENNCDAIIAVGGGSVIDTSKTANILVSEGGDDLLKYSGAHNLPRPLKPFFVIPTTSGTGSEVTLAAVVSDNQKNVKMAFASNYLMPHAAILYPRMTQTLPPHLTAWTWIDAVAHALEGATARTTSPAGLLYGLEALRILSEYLPRAVEDGADLDVRGRVLWGSMVAGLALHNCNTHMGHNISHALGSLARIHHGLATGLALEVSLPWLVARPEGAENYALAAEALGGPAEAEALPEAYAALMRACQIAPELPSVCAGVTADALSVEMKNAANHSMSQNSACPVSPDDLDEMAGMMVGLPVAAAAG